MPPDATIKLKRSVLRRVVSTKLEALKRGDFYVRNHLGPECYGPIVAEAKGFLDSPLYRHYSESLASADAASAPSAPPPPQDLPPPPSLSEDLDTFVHIIAASILIDASMRGENAGESDPRFIKKKKKLLTKTLKGIKFMEFTSQIWRYDCITRGIDVPPEEESEVEQDNNSNNNNNNSDSNSSDDSDQDNTSVTTHTSADGFSTSASNSKRHVGNNTNSSSLSDKKKHKKEKKKAMKKERKHKRREEKRRRKEERKRKKLEGKKKKKRKREEREEDMDESRRDYDQNNDADDEPNTFTDASNTNTSNGKLEEDVERQEEEDEESVYDYEIEHATKEEFETFRSDVLAKVPDTIKKRFREGGFSKWGKDWLPVLEIGPFDVEPGPVRTMWMEMFQNTRQNGREMTRLVFWYGVKYEDRGQAYSFVPSSKIISFEEGEKGGNCKMPKKIKAKMEKGLKLTKTEEQIERGLRELQLDMQKDKSDRIQWMMHFQEEYELAESMPEPKPESPEAIPVDDDVEEVKIKRKPGRPKKSESLKKDEKPSSEKPVKRKPGRPKKSESKTGEDAPIKRKPGRPKKSDAEKAKSKKAKAEIAKEKKFEIVDEDEDDFAFLDSDDDADKDYNENTSDSSDEDADDELSNADQRKRKATDEPKKRGRKKLKPHLTPEEEKEERRQKAAEYREKKRREKAEALGLDYVPGRKKSKKKLFEEEQKRFTECEVIFQPLIEDLEQAKEEHNAKSAIGTIEKITANVEKLTPPYLRTYPLGMLVRDIRKAFETSDPEVKEHCKRLTNEMKRVYNLKEKSTPDDFVPKKRSDKKASSLKSDGIQKIEPANDVSMADAVKTEDTSISYPNQALRTSEIVTTDPVKTDPSKSEPTKQPKKAFSIKGMFEKPKPIPKPKVAPTPAVIISGPVSPKPKSLPAWVTGPAMKMDEFHEQHAKERNLALEFLNDAATLPSHKIDPMSISQTLELAIFAETKLRGRDWNQYWEKVHDVVAMISPGKDQPNAIMLGIARGDYQDPSQLVTLSRREIRSLNQQRTKSPI